MTLPKEKCTGGPQISYDTSTGTGDYLIFSGSIQFTPAIIIFDNQSNVSVTISDDEVTDWKTFSSGQGLTLDLRTNRINGSSDFSWPIGTEFYAKSTAGIGLFYISYVYAS